MPGTSKSFRGVAILAVAAALYGSSLACCGSSQGCSGAPFQAPTATPTATAALTSTPTPDLSYLDWPVVISDSFDKDEKHFWTGDVDYDTLTVTAAITGGHYLIKATAKQGMYWGIQAEMADLDDFYLSAEVIKKSGPETANYGLSFRNRDGADYYFGMTAGTQEYFAGVGDATSWKKFIDTTWSPLINPDSLNRLAVLAQGSHFTLFINGEVAATFEDDTLKKGVAGFSLTILKAGESLELEFDNFEVRAPQ
jgi:hypothetical protein